MKIYSATKDGKTVSRKSANVYTHGVIAIFPDKSIRLISCHNGIAAAQRASLMTSGTASRYTAFRNGAHFEVAPLAVTEAQ